MKQIVSVSEYLLDYLRTEIIIGEMKPGEKVNEYQLSQSLEISRPILREVLRSLEGEHLVLTVPRKGSFVSETNLQDFIELYEIREMIEFKAIDLIEQNKINSVNALREAIEKEADLKIPPPEAGLREYLTFFEQGMTFHHILVETAGNKRLLQYYKGIQHNLLRYHVSQGSKNLAADSPVTHVELVEWLEKGRYEKAKQYLHEHIESHSKIIRENLEEGT